MRTASLALTKPLVNSDPSAAMATRCIRLRSQTYCSHLGRDYGRMSTVALCASAAEVHGLAISTQIVQEYVKSYLPNSDVGLMPSYRQWEALVNVCSGILSKSTFGSVVEFFTKFYPQDQLCGDPKQIASAIEGLAKISSGLMRSMVLIGNAECGFLAPAAQWLLSLRVVIQDINGDIVYPGSKTQMDDYQLLVIFSDDKSHSESLRRIEDAYYIGYISEIIPDIVGADYVSGRVEWETVFFQTFGSPTRKLIQAPGILGEILGSAAKIYGDPNIEEKPEKFVITKENRFAADSSGRGFVELICKQLPEFAGSREVMYSAVERSVDEAYLHFERAMRILENICSCSRHCERQSTESTFINLTGKGKGSASSLQGGDKRFCLRRMAFTIILLARLLSSIASKPDDLRLRRRGLNALYERVSQVNLDYSNSDISFLFVLDSMSLIDLAMLIFGVDQPFAYHKPAYSQRQNMCTAMVSGGLCFVMRSVTTVTSSAKDLLRLHIILGHIEWKDRIYSTLRDGRQGSPKFVMPPVIFPISTAQYKMQMQLLDDMVARAVVTESAECLRMSYEIKNSSGTFHLAPGALSD